ncbi:hypothetical protein RJ639_039766 [Escallonia herrerae]|uniref:Uncharacterized protein n=1 Tax=Escallonia herrerae TaxID=1293975 RepID=A0AA88WLG2_9ASTE|nr:hypothetical protein RJ639_039766 [Escallonia herrerae]
MSLDRRNEENGEKAKGMQKSQTKEPYASYSYQTKDQLMESHRWPCILLFVFLVVLLCMLAIPGLSIGMRNPEVKCIQSERRALLKLKEGFVDYLKLLAS